VIGGFRTEVTWPIIQEVVAFNDATTPENRCIFFINGAATDWLCVDHTVPGNETHKYIFRVMPINSTMLFMNVLGYISGYLLPVKLKPMYSANATNPLRYGVLVENLEWTAGIYNYFKYVGLGPNTTCAFAEKSSATAGEAEFEQLLNYAEGNGTRMLAIAYTYPNSAALIRKWGEGHYNFTVVGIDVTGQLQAYPTMTSYKCEYEVGMITSATNISIIPGLTQRFWTNFEGNFSAWPIYTAFGAYNGLLTLKRALEDADTLDPTTVVNVLKAGETQVLTGKGKFTANTNDVFSISYGPYWPDGYARAQMGQWVNRTISKTEWRFEYECKSPIDQSYSRKTRIPPWIYPLADWDLNFDGKVETKDVARVSKAFGTMPGSAGWDIEADVNYDGKVETKDVAAVSKKFGSIVKPWPIPYP
jgi:hypothetical protein